MTQCFRLVAFAVVVLSMLTTATEANTPPSDTTPPLTAAATDSSCEDIVSDATLSKWYAKVLAGRMNRVRTRLSRDADIKQWDYSGGDEELDDMGEEQFLNDESSNNNDKDKSSNRRGASSGVGGSSGLRQRITYKEDHYLGIQAEMKERQRQLDIDNAKRRLAVHNLHEVDRLPHHKQQALERRGGCPPDPSTASRPSLLSSFLRSPWLWLVVDSFSIAVVAYIPLHYVLARKMKVK